jgi:hypothetical protein
VRSTLRSMVSEEREKAKQQETEREKHDNQVIDRWIDEELKFKRTLYDYVKYYDTSLVRKHINTIIKDFISAREC